MLIKCAHRMQSTSVRNVNSSSHKKVEAIWFLCSETVLLSTVQKKRSSRGLESNMALPNLESLPDFTGRLQPQDYGEVPRDRATGQTSKTPKAFCNPIMAFICVMFWPREGFSTSEIWVFLVGTELHSKSQLISHPVKYLDTQHQKVIVLSTKALHAQWDETPRMPYASQRQTQNTWLKIIYDKYRRSGFKSVKRKEMHQWKLTACSNISLLILFSVNMSDLTISWTQSIPR